MSFLPWCFSASSGCRSPSRFFWFFHHPRIDSPVFPCFFLFFQYWKDFDLRCCVYFFGSKFLFKRKCWLFIFSVGLLPQIFFFVKKNRPVEWVGFRFFLVCGETHRLNDIFFLGPMSNWGILEVLVAINCWNFYIFTARRYSLTSPVKRWLVVIWGFLFFFFFGCWDGDFRVQDLLTNMGAW